MAKSGVRKARLRWPLALAVFFAIQPAERASAQDDRARQPSATHIVRPGDTLWDISNRYMQTPMRWPQLQRDNAVDVPERLQPGQVLTLGDFATAVGVSGDVFFERDAGVEQPLSVGAILKPGDILKTGRNGFLAIGLADGSRIVIPTSSTARLIVARGSSTKIELLNGRIESYVEKKKKREFEIRTQTYSLGVKGTHFRARSEAGDSALEVLEGSVVATPLSGDSLGIAVFAGQGTLLDPANGAQVRALLAPPQQRLAPESRWVVASPVKGAESYRLQLARDPEFVLLAAESHGDSPRFRLADDLAPGFYHTRISAFDSRRIEGRPGSGMVFVPHADAPEEGGAKRRSDGTYEIRWTPRPARRHTFELALDPDFAALLVSQSGHFPGGVAIGPLRVPDRYYWRCREEVEGESLPQPSWGGSFEVPAI